MRSTNTQLERGVLNQLLIRFAFTLIVGIGLLVACIQPMSEAEFQQRQAERRASMSYEASYAAPVLGVVVDEKLQVIDIDPGSSAERSGVQKGDVLISIAEIPFATEKDKAKELIWGSASEKVYEEYNKTGKWNGTPLRLQVERNGETINLEIVPFPPMWDPKAPPTPGYPPLDYI